MTPRERLARRRAQAKPEYAQKGAKDRSFANPGRHRNIHTPKLLNPGGVRKSPLGGGRRTYVAPTTQGPAYMYGSASGQAHYNARKQRTRV